MSKNKKKRKQLSHLESVIKQSEEKLYQEALEKLKEAEEGEVIEKMLKNEAYGFILSEGLLDKFLEYREHFHRTKAQDALYNLIAEAHLGGLWIDL